MKYMIHACKKRLWYVDNFLIPSMQSQGIRDNDIILWNDNSGKGNLYMFLKSMEAIAELLPANEAVWHLQDDVMISSDFKGVTEACSKDSVCNGFCAFERSHFGYIGWQNPKCRWLSFQATQIPVRYCAGFIDWWEDEILRKNREARRRKENKHDDHFFWLYMTEVHPNDRILNIAPNIVQHIDYMLGGSVLDNETERRISKARYWRESEAEERLSEQIKQFLKDEDAWQDQE